MSEDARTRWLDDETEKKHSKMAYNAVSEICPTELLPEDDPFGEVTAALVVGLDEDNNFHVIVTAPEEQQDMMSFIMNVVRDVLSNFSAYKDVYYGSKGDEDE